MPRKRHVSRNFITREEAEAKLVMPRKRHVSRNTTPMSARQATLVMPRKRHVSRNDYEQALEFYNDCHASQEACE